MRAWPVSHRVALGLLAFLSPGALVLRHFVGALVRRSIGGRGGLVAASAGLGFVSSPPLTSLLGGVGLWAFCCPLLPGTAERVLPLGLLVVSALCAKEGVLDAR